MEIKICRQIDRLGRLVIPIDLRRQYGLKPMDEVLFVACENGILIRLEVSGGEESKKK